MAHGVYLQNYQEGKIYLSGCIWVHAVKLFRQFGFHEYRIQESGSNTKVAGCPCHSSEMCIM